MITTPNNLNEITRYLARLGGHFSHVAYTEMMAESRHDIWGTYLKLDEIDSALSYAREEGIVEMVQNDDGDEFYILNEE